MPIEIAETCDKTVAWRSVCAAALLSSLLGKLALCIRLSAIMMTATDSLVLASTTHALEEMVSC